jgi:hypothetical protein
MPGAITNTSPLLYLGRIGALGWLDQLFGTVWVPSAVLRELDQGRALGFEVPRTARMRGYREIGYRIAASPGPEPIGASLDSEPASSPEVLT